ncbi:unnamed protein product [Oncorhynchus mykiss]|uniref:Uncharacterized protein n=1 Tax=Oncorhynchus mykiss TaxID=8022 RepID=A0A060YSV1_ONCMY|nr:unnamed protein product [Oncorhynchus mykiss]
MAREHKNIVHYKRSLEEFETLGVPQTEQGRLDLELKIEDTKESIRKAETVKLKAEARLDLLRQVGVAVDTWLKSAMNQVMEELENERWATVNYTTHDPSLSVRHLPSLPHTTPPSLILEETTHNPSLHSLQCPSPTTCHHHRQMFICHTAAKACVCGLQHFGPVCVCVCVSAGC